MHITKYPQSCLKIEKDGRALLVDVGTLATQKYSVSDFGKYDAVLFTHCHGDHFDKDVLAELANGGDITLYGNDDTAKAAGDEAIEVITDGEELVVAGFKIKAFNMEHCLMPDGSPAGIANTAYLIDDTLLLTGDSTEKVDLKPKAVALPIFGPDISFKDAFTFARDHEVQEVIPVHYTIVGMNPSSFGMFSDMYKGTWKLHALADGESVDL